MPNEQTQTVLSSNPVEWCESLPSENSLRHESPPSTYYGFPWADSADMSLYSQLQSSHHRTVSEGRHIARNTGMIPGQESPDIPANLEGSFVPQTPIGLGIPKDNSPPKKKRIDDIEREEDDIRNAREELLGARFELKDQRGQVRNLRQKTGMEEGTVISQIRNIFQQSQLEFPAELENAFTRVIELRDRLGSLEGDYEEKEEIYEQLEWKYTQQEANFVAKLTDEDTNPIVGNANVGADNSNLYAIGAVATGAMPTRFEKLQTDLTKLPEMRREHGLECIEIGAQEKEQLLSSTPLQGCQLPETTFGCAIAAINDEVFSPIPRAYSETAISQALLAWNDTRKRIDAWIFDTVFCSSYQKLVLRNMLSRDDLSEEEWWRLVKQTWTSDSSSTPPAGLNGELSTSSRETIHLPIVPSGKADTERPKMDLSQPKATQNIENVRSAQSAESSIVPRQKESKKGSNIISVSYNDTQPSTHVQHKESKEGESVLPSYGERIIEGATSITTPYHIRHHSSPGPIRCAPVEWQPGPYEDPSSTMHSDCECSDVPTNCGSFVLLYEHGEGLPSTPKIRSPCPGYEPKRIRRVVVQRRSTQG